LGRKAKVRENFFFEKKKKKFFSVLGSTEPGWAGSNPTAFASSLH
jgi:hypothetical protein